VKIAIFHNYMDNIGGAEILCFTLARELNADIYTTNISSEKIKKMGFGDVLPRIKSIGKVPINAPFRHQIALLKFRFLKLKGYDYHIIAGDWAMSGAVRNKPCMWYINSPFNELWQYKDWLRNEVIESWKKIPFDVFVWFNRFLSKRYIKHYDCLVSNSNNVKNRVMKYYGKESVVIHPPTYTSKYEYKESKGYWLSVNRLITHKRIELQMKAMAKLPNEKLIIVGSYEKGANQFESYMKYIESIKPSNVEIVNWVSDDKLKELYSECKGVLCTAMDEDFGMTPVEAMASGKPVIAVNEGGYKETVIDGVTGKLIKADVDSLVEAINEVGEDVEKYKDACLKRAKEFDVEKFIEKIREEMKWKKNL
jgi:glycosyltransferase involved in cell wall biosynthesis